MRTVVFSTAVLLLGTLWVLAAERPAGQRRTKNASFARLLSDADQKMAIGDAKEALALAERAVKEKPKDARALATRATVKIALKDMKGALADASQATTLDKTFGKAFFIRGRAKEELGFSQEEVLADYRKAAQLDPRYTPSYNDAIAQAAMKKPALKTPAKDRGLR